MELLRLIVSWIMVLFVGALAGIILWKIFTGKIDLMKLISEDNGNASMSRFQFMIFTFVVALMWIYLFFDAKGLAFPNIPNGVLGLMGISGGSYVLSKGIQKSFEGDVASARAKASTPLAPNVIVPPAAGPDVVVNQIG